MRFSLFFFLCCNLGACATQSLVGTNSVSSFSGRFKCLAKSKDTAMAGYTVQMEVKEVNGVPIMVTKQVGPKAPGALDNIFVRVIDGKWHSQDVLVGKNKIITKKVQYTFVGPNKIRGLSKAPTYTSDSGTVHKALQSEQFESIDEEGNIIMTSSKFQGSTTCLRQ